MALEAVCKIAVRFRANDQSIDLTVTRDQWRMNVANGIGRVDFLPRDECADYFKTAGYEAVLPDSRLVGH